MPKIEYFLYGSAMSLYTGKARSYLRKKGVPFEMRSTSHPGYARAARRIGRPYQPILETLTGEFIQDTTEIIDFIEPRYPGQSVYPSGSCQRLAALLLELYGDEGLLKPAMHYRWNFPETNDPFLASEFGRGLSATEIPLPGNHDAVVAAGVRWGAVSSMMRGKALPAYGVNVDSIPVIEAAYEDLLDRLEAHLTAFPYLLGGLPSVGDFGLIAPLYAHLGRDPYPLGLMKERAPMLYRWVERMNASESDMAEFPHQRAAFLHGDEVPTSLLDLLSLAAADYLPELLGIFAAVEAWLAAHPTRRSTDPLPVTTAAQGLDGPFGAHRVQFRGGSVEVGVRHYSIWMAQRPMDFYAGLRGEDRDRADQMLEATGLRPLFDLSPSFRLERRDHREYWVAPATHDGKR